MCVPTPRVSCVAPLVGTCLSFFVLNFPASFKLVSSLPRSFPSILRRSLVIIMKGRFESPEILAQMQFPSGSPAGDGYFPADPELKTFLSSKPSAAAMLHILMGWATQHTESSARHVIHSYVTQGLDGGVTRRTLLASCGLKEPRPAVTLTSFVPGEQATQTALAIEAPDGMPTLPPVPVGIPPTAFESVEARRVGVEAGEAEDNLRERHSKLFLWFIESERDLLTRTVIMRMPAEVWPGVSMARRFQTFRDLVDAGLWKKLPKRGKMSEVYIPVVACRNTLDTVLPQVKEVQALMPLLETVHASPLYDPLHAVRMSANDACFLSFFEAQVTRGKHGVETEKEIDAREEWQRKAQKHRAHLVALRSLRERAGASRAPIADAVLQGSQAVIQQKVCYKQKHGELGRRYAEEHGTQNLSRRLRAVLLPVDAEDWDLSNAMPSLVSAVLPRLEPAGEIPLLKIPKLSAYAADTEAIRTWLLRETGQSGKHLALAVAHGMAVPVDLPQGVKDWCRDVGAEARALRWLACSQLPELHMKLIEEGRRWPENACFALWWQTLEDRVLMHVVSWLLEAHRDHLSLHFDGFMLRRSDAEDSRSFGERLHEATLRLTGMPLRWERKFPQTFLERLALNVPGGSRSSFLLQDLLRGAGTDADSLVLAVDTMIGVMGALQEAKLARGASEPNSYGSWAAAVRATIPEKKDFRLHPSYGLCRPALAAPILVHMAVRRGTRCILMQHAGDTDVSINFGGPSFVLAWASVREAFEHAVDASQVVCFREGAVDLTGCEAKLLQLLVG